MPEAAWKAYEYLRQGGWIMLPLLGCSMAMWMAILDRWSSFRALSAGDLDIPASIRAVAAADPVPGDGLRARLVRAFRERRTGDPALDRRILHECSLSLRGGLRDRLAAIAVLAAVAPLLGLLGTVLGMIETFDVISTFGTGNARAMAGGISVALVTTQTGLLVAIPGLFISGALARRSRSLQHRLDEVVTVLDRHVKQGGPARSEAPS